MIGVLTQELALVEDQDQSASLTGLKKYFIEMFFYSCAIVPALDALALKLKNTVPGMKKKKGALPAEVEQLQRDVWNALKTGLKNLSTSLEKRSDLLSASLVESYTESRLLDTVTTVLPSYLEGVMAVEDIAADGERVATVVREKASEYASEKGA